MIIDHRFVCYTVSEAAEFIVNFNGFILWILVSISTIWQYIAFVTLPMYCSASNQISLSSAPSAHHDSCVAWYGQATCWGQGKYLQCFCHFDLSVSLCSSYYEFVCSVKVSLANWVKEIPPIIGILRLIQSV